MIVAAKIAVFKFDQDEVRLAVVRAGSGLPSVLEAHTVRARSGNEEGRFDALVDAVRQADASLKHRPNAYVLCVSGFYAVVRRLTIPFRGSRRVAAAVTFELERYLAFPIEDLVVDYIKVGESGKETEVLTVGLRRSVLEEQVNVLKAAGIEPGGATIDAVCLAELWRASRPSGKGLKALLHVVEDGAVLAVLDNKTLVYFRHLALTAAQIQASPAALGREVHNSLRAFAGSKNQERPVESIAVAGIEFFEEERQLFEREVEQPVTFENPAARIKGLAAAVGRAGAGGVSEADGAEGPRRGSGTWASAAGAALVAAGAPNGLDFLKGPMASRESAANRLPLLLTSCCLALVLLVGWAVYLTVARNRDLAEAADLKARIAEVQQQVSDLQSQGIAVPMEVFTQPVLLDILNEIAAKLPDDKAGISEIRVESGAESVPWITIRGIVRNDAAFDAAFAELRQTTLFRVDPDPGKVLDQDVTTFRIVAWKPESEAAGS